jgi:hypothetical protein
MYNPAVNPAGFTVKPSEAGVAEVAEPPALESVSHAEGVLAACAVKLSVPPPVFNTVT